LEPFKVVQGRVAVPTRPGLGVEINPEAVKKYAVDTGV
jgi:L-alanine-DL-glutamate epimerase-like enolase superfamily enzyme